VVRAIKEISKQQVKIKVLFGNMADINECGSLCDSDHFPQVGGRTTRR